MLLIMAEKLGEFSELIGGYQHLYCLLAPLELLATAEESAVRDKVG